MKLVQAPAESPLTPAQLASAEILVAGQLGLPTLAQRENIGQAGNVGPGGLIHLRSPATSIQTVFVRGTLIPNPVLLTPLAVDVSEAIQPYLTGGLSGLGYGPLPYTVTYTGGWTEATLPEAIEQAVLLTAAALAATGERGGVVSERMGPVAYTYSDPATTASLPADALAYLRPWLPLRV